MKETVGKVSSELLQKSTHSVSAIEQMEEQLSEYETNIFDCIEKYRLIFLKGFYIVVITKREPLMQNVFRHYFLARQSCPTPDYDQTVYSYINDKLSFMWVIPNREACIYLKNNALTVDKSERFLLNFVLQDEDGSLLLKAKQLNGEL
jgi:hypothetical protein